MYLKEAFRYQNFLSGLVEKSVLYLSTRSYITKTTQEHLRKKANPEAEDETIEVAVDRPYECTNNQLISLLEHLMDEKEKLTAAISAAKKASDVDIDAELANNRVRQRIATVLHDMGKVRATENVVRGTGYKFNGEGNQVPYNYDIKQVMQIDFDRNKVKRVSRSLTAKSDEVSTCIDKVMVEMVVEYEPQYSINDSFEDVVEQFISKNKPEE